MSMIPFGMIQFAHASNNNLGKQYNTCMKKAGGVTSKMHDCISAETKRQDTRLNKSYKALMPTLNATRKKELQNVQRLWIKYRDANCKFYYDPEGGSIAAVNSGVCYLEETAYRATKLEDLKS